MKCFALLQLNFRIFANVAFLFCLPILASAQNKFDEKKLLDPKKNGPEIKAAFKEEFVYEFRIGKGKHAIFLKNGLRSSQFVSPELWLNSKDTIHPYRVDVVYSRYPVHNNEYQEIYPLLCNRLIHLFELDPNLNDDELEWRTILQTHIDNDEQVNTLFHGIVIWYRNAQEEQMFQKSLDSSVVSNPLVQTDKTQGGLKEMEKNIAMLKESSLMEESLRNQIENKPLDVQRKLIQEHLKTMVAKPSTIKLKDRTPLEMFTFKRQVGEFLKNNPFSDSVVWKVFDRHPDWADALVVNDWTGSMYGYGAQVVHWHLLNYKTSGIRFISLFNDGDMKTNSSKIIGETGGIYSAEAADIPKIIGLFNLVRINGSGGDRQENDIEAILESMKRFPDHKEIILIADNLACIRDIELATKINKPVRVVICGYSKEFGINPHLAYLAKITGGGLYTLEEDIINLKMDAIGIGEISNFKDKRFVISPINCKPQPIYDLKYGKESFKTYYHLDSALIDRKLARQLNLNEQQWMNFPKEIIKLKLLLTLDMSGNSLKQIPGSIKQLENLKSINLSNNFLKTLPNGFAKLLFLESIDLSNNQLVNIEPFFASWYYVKKLNLSNNQLKSTIGLNQLKNLQYANLANNNFVELPLEINQLKRLISLDLSNNQLLYLPRTLIGLNKLEELNLENNQIGSLPPYLYRLRKLKVLNLANNPIGEKEKDRIRKELPNVEITF